MFIMGEKSMMGYIFNRMELKRNIFSQASLKLKDPLNYWASKTHWLHLKSDRLIGFSTFKEIMDMVLGQKNYFQAESQP